MMCRHYHLVGLREEDVLLDDTHVGRLPQFPPAPLSQLPNSLGHLPTEKKNQIESTEDDGKDIPSSITRSGKVYGSAVDFVSQRKEWLPSTVAIEKAERAVQLGKANQMLAEIRWLGASTRMLAHIRSLRAGFDAAMEEDERAVHRQKMLDEIRSMRTDAPSETVTTTAAAAADDASAV